MKWKELSKNDTVHCVPTPALLRHCFQPKIALMRKTEYRKLNAGTEALQYNRMAEMLTGIVQKYQHSTFFLVIKI